MKVASKSRLGAVIVASAVLLPTLAYAGNTKLEVKIESESFVAGSKVIELDDNVPQTITFEKPALVAFDKRCSLFGLVGPDGSIPTVVSVQVTTKRLDNGNVLARADLKATKAGPTRDSLVSAAGDHATCPSQVGVINDAMANLKVGEAQVIFSGWDDMKEANISVSLTLQ